ncbi:MAG: intermembrane transport protein PqiB [Steroidobacteraceae bacterium]
MTEELPIPRINSRRWTPSLIWLVPIAAALVGLSLLINTWRETGPRITISFQTAEGLEVGKTLVKYRNVTIGHVTAITLSRDRSLVLVTVDLQKSAQDAATADTLFWVARPRFGVGWVSGLDTLLSGEFIDAEPGASKARRVQFIGLENPPPLAHPSQGKQVVLHAQDVGSVSLGAPVYFRRLPVGRVIDEKLDADGGGTQLVLFIDSPNDRFVTQGTRFWNVSGIDLSVGANGMDFKAQSLISVLAGGIEFGPAADTHDVLPATTGDQFTLYRNEASAMAPPDGEPRFVRMRFQQSLRGLAIGAPVEFVGVDIGSVISIDLEYDVNTQRFPVIVTARIYPRRMGRAEEALLHQGTTESDDKVAHFVGQLVARGLRAQPRTGSLLSGQLYLALDFIPGAAKVAYNPASRPLEIPTIRGSIDELQLHLASIANKIDGLPLGDIAHHLDSDLTSLHGTLDHINGDVLPAATATFGALQSTLDNVDRTLADDSPWRDSLEQTLSEARRAMRSVRSLTDYLNSHPEALIRGRQVETPRIDAHDHAQEGAP